MLKPNQMFTVGLVPSQQLVSLLTDENGEYKDIPEGQSVVPLVKIPKPETGAWEPNLVWFADRVERQWIAGTPAPAPTFTADQWVDAQGFDGKRPTTCLYLLLQLQAAGKSSPKLAAVQSWMDQMIAAGVTNPNEARSDWPLAPYSFTEASGEALAVLQS